MIAMDTKHRLVEESIDIGLGNAHELVKGSAFGALKIDGRASGRA
jgi:hypothetical protein